MLLHFTEAANSVCLLKKVFTTRRQKALDVFQGLWLLMVINFIIEQIFAEHRFLKNTYAWLLLNVKVLFWIWFMFCYHRVRMLQKGFSQLFFAWSVKSWVSLKLWNNHSRDWVNNFHLPPALEGLWSLHIIYLCELLLVFHISE